jgi:hypothetical protein
MHRGRHGNRNVCGKIMELSKPYKGKRKRKIKKMPFTVKGYILYYAFFWVVIISIYLAYY